MKPTETIKRAIRADVPLTECLVRTALAIAIPTSARWIIDNGAYGSPFLLYFPAVQAIATFLGWRWGVATALGSAVAGAYFFMPELSGPVIGADHAVSIGLFALAVSPMIVMGQVLRQSVLENYERARQNEEFNKELQHRTKNSIQMVSALVSQARKAPDAAAFYDKLAARLGALAKANELLRYGVLSSCDMQELVSGAVAPYARDQVAIHGPSCSIAKNACTPLVMALHELGTNAQKYGALSVPEGQVDISWDVSGSEIVVNWREQGGPVVRQPAHTGLGTRLITQQSQFRAVSLDFRSDGLTCVIRLAAER
ncbi:sensor histidine kinase [Novosphingobium sp. HII-3]|uniref:sensor histidine kinase n=1 Tax=Novosphingobium sp. HII-3 TaxID=2075565 RepID=UPI000CDB4107|nr:HWE histidine kinase domain-containing protein [Novosphingobium sp. HII-3]